jgi:hypothetical protein
VDQTELAQRLLATAEELERTRREGECFVKGLLSIAEHPKKCTHATVAECALALASVANEAVENAAKIQQEPRQHRLPEA